MIKNSTNGWDPAVLRKYSTTGHFRLLNQVRSELRAQPLVRPGDGQTVAEVNRSRALTRAIASKAAGSGRPRRSGGRTGDNRTPLGQAMADPLLPVPSPNDGDGAAASSFRDRLNAIDMR
ncbi:MAG: hypothetical protein VKN13_04610 [Cyanobacteriota bacterium]|nr:hypothetical protein [Cyanobacteriota bacterium]